MGLLGDFKVKCDLFPDLDTIFKEFRTPQFRLLNIQECYHQINAALLKLIQAAPEPAFLLAAVTEYMGRVNSEKLLNESYRLSDFEFWLNNFSGLNEAANYTVRAKITGKWVVRDEFQYLFPIGMGKRFAGSHFITAHISPDVDTTIASFTGWLDAFSARVGEGLHLWSLPGGAPDSHITYIMQNMFGASFFENLVRISGTLTLTSMDLLTQHGLEKALSYTLTATIEHDNENKAVIFVDNAGHYIDDWHSSDVELVRQVAVHFSACLRWFENNLHVKLISLFSQPKPHADHIHPFLSSLFDTQIKDCEPAKDLTEIQKRHLNDYLDKILHVAGGLEGNFGALAAALDRLEIHEFAKFRREVESLANPDLFDKEGKLKEDRPKLFSYIYQIIKGLDDAIQAVRTYVDRLDVMVAVKRQVLNHLPQFVTLRSDVEEIRIKMKNYSYLTVVIPDKYGKWFPVGIVRATDLRMPILGTVTLRDFCNFEEIKMASYLEVISVIDHHKSSLKTSTPPLALIGDAQSCNVLIAEQAFRINDKYSLGGLSAEEIDGQAVAARTTTGASAARLHQRILQRQIALHQGNGGKIHPLREFSEYLYFLYAILDDTDLLSKVSNRDIECVVQLLNRLKSLSLRRDVEILSLDNIPKDKQFAKKAAERVLQNEDMYSLYKKIYDFKEEEVVRNLECCAKGKPSNIFSDTKEQNGCSRVGQMKLFASNIPLFQSNINAYRTFWLQEAKRTFEENPELDLHMQMSSTITGADEVYRGNAGNYAHKDEIWVWVPQTQLAYEHLANFLNAFSNAPEVMKSEGEVELIGPNAMELDELFAQNFAAFPRTIAKNKESSLPIAILRFTAGAINSRKSMITPYIPKRIP